MTTTNTQAAQGMRIKNVGFSVTLNQAVKMAVRHYRSIGDLKKARPVLNKVIARSNIDFGWRDLVKGYQELAKECLKKEKDDILRDWQFEKVLTRVAPLILENPEFQRIALNAIAEGIFALSEPLKFVRRYSKYTDSNGRIYGKKTALEEENGKQIFVTKFTPINLTATNATKILESAFENFHRLRKNAIIGGKLDICFSVSNGQISAKYEAVQGENGEFVKGGRIK